MPSQSDTWPDGWSSFALGPDAPEPGWVSLMADVDPLGFHHGDPTCFYIFQMWDLGLDSAAITLEDAVRVEVSTWSRVKGLFGD
ncbi:hypothetical protein GF314_02085 [bacterium]|nr:hypothetical protein [bacterium]